MKRKLLILGGLILVVIVGGLIYLQASQSTEPLSLQDLERDPFFEEPITPDLPVRPGVGLGIERPEEAEAVEEPDKIAEPIEQALEINQQGVLVYKANQQRIGEEIYSLTTTPNGEYVLRSKGYFLFKLVVVDAKFNFEQEIRWNEDFQPLWYETKFEGPLGVGNREMHVEFDWEKTFATARIISKNDETEIQLPSEPLVLQGLFSSYAILPLLLQSQDFSRYELFIASGFGGQQSDQGTESPSVNFLDVEFSKLPRVNIVTTSGPAEVERYDVKQSRNNVNSTGTFELLILNGEFVGVYAHSPEDAEEESSFQVFRKDLFGPDFDWSNLD